MTTALRADARVVPEDAAADLVDLAGLDHPALDEEAADGLLHAELVAERSEELERRHVPEPHRPLAEGHAVRAGEAAALEDDAGVVRPEDLPRRRLRFAEYLYYSGRARWSELVEAIAWQRAQRPPVGRIAVGLGFLAHDDVGVILERRRLAGANGIPFCEWAIRLGYLKPFQALAILGQQLRLQRPSGEYFVARGVLGPDEIDAIRDRILRHNGRFPD